MKKVNCLLSVCITLLVVGLCGTEAVFASAESKVCPGLDYQNDKCTCDPAQKCQQCPCNPCTGDGKCACITATRESAGTITGTVTVVRTKVKTKGSKSYKDVVVYLEKVGNNDFPTLSKHIKMNQRGLVFIPHILAIQKGTTVEFLNNDNDKHNVYLFNDKTGEKIEVGTAPPGKSMSRRFDKPNKNKLEKDGEPKTLITLCTLHLEMAAYIAVFDNPFFTVASIEGTPQKAQYTIKNVPPGKYQLNIWHKKLKLKEGSKEIIVEQGKSTTVDVEITKAKYAKKKG